MLRQYLMVNSIEMFKPQQSDNLYMLGHANHWDVKISGICDIQLLGF